MNASVTAAPIPVPWWRVVAVGRNPRVTAIRLLALILLTVLTFQYALVPIRVTGISMSPGLKDGERKWISPLMARLTGIRRGDVVAIQTSGRQVMYLKRVIGLPGERVQIRKGDVYINGNLLPEPYLFNRSTAWDWPKDGQPRLLGPNDYFVVGDNRAMPPQNHYFGVADRSRILGKVIR
jgi:signal peptidase I